MAGRYMEQRGEDADVCLPKPQTASVQWIIDNESDTVGSYGTEMDLDAIL